MDKGTAEYVKAAAERALDTLFGEDEAKVLTRERVAQVIWYAAQDAATFARDGACASLMTSTDAAVELGVTRRRIVALAQARGLGHKTTAGYLFTPEEIESMRVRRGGRPKAE